MRDALAVSIAAPKATLDAVVRTAVAPLVATLSGAGGLDAISFERFNKPDWGIRLRVLGAAAWLDAVARREIERQLTEAGVTFTFIEAAADDKWVGGRDDEELLHAIDHADTAASVALLEAEASGSLSTSRAQWSLLVIEGMLDHFGLSGDDRLAFYRRGWEWAREGGRWDAEVFDVLEGKYESQRDVLRGAVAGATSDAWGGAGPERIARTLLDAVRDPIEAIRPAVTSGKTVKSVLDFAVVVGHAHSNRLGIHATQEATIRYLVWRASGGRRPASV